MAGTAFSASKSLPKTLNPKTLNPKTLNPKTLGNKSKQRPQHSVERAPGAAPADTRQ
jgi:hypothetical protein